MAFDASAIIEITSITNCYTQQCLGEIEVTATGNAGPFVIKWGSGANQSVSNINGTHTIYGRCPNTEYSITVTNQYGCAKILTARIGQCDGSQEFAIEQKSLVHSTSPGAALGSIDISVNASGLPYPDAFYYKWTDPGGQIIGGSQDLQHLDAGFYCVEVTSGCATATKCFEIKDCTCACPIDIEFAMNFNCSPGITKGSIAANTDSEFPPFTYQWSGPDGFTSTAQKLYSIQAGNYCVTMTDNCGRTGTKCQNVTCCDRFELPTITTAYECFSWEDILGISHYHDGHLEVDLVPYHYTRSPECNAQYTLKWNVDNSENVVTFNTQTNAWEGATVKHIQAPGNYCVTVTNNCGCSRVSCRTFGSMGHYSGFDWQRLDAFLAQNVPGYSIGEFYDEDYPVLTKCFQCNACGMDRQTNVVGMDCDETGGQFDFFSYSDPEPDDEKPCSGGFINCANNPPSATGPWTILEGLEGIEIVDKSSPPQTVTVNGQPMCVYPTWCLFPSGYIDNFPVRLPVIVKHPVGKIVPPSETGPCNPSPPANADCPGGGYLMNDGISEDCILYWFCSTSNQVVEIDNSFQDFIFVCECLIETTGGDTYCATVKRCDLNASVLGDPNICHGFEILFNDCEGPFPSCPPVARPSPSGRSVAAISERSVEPTENNRSGIRIYPNPFTGDVRIDFEKGPALESGNIRVEVSDLGGRVLGTFQKDSNNTSFTMELPLKEYNIPSGTYILNVKIDNARYASFLIIKPRQ